jgi:hypothetical protein
LNLRLQRRFVRTYWTTLSAAPPHAFIGADSNH